MSKKAASIVKVPRWAETLVDIITDESGDGRLETWEKVVRPIVVSDPKLAKRYEKNYKQWIDGNCAGCVEGMPDCGYMKRQANTRDVFMAILEGTAHGGEYNSACTARVNGTMVFHRGRFSDLDLRTEDETPIHDA